MKVERSLIKTDKVLNIRVGFAAFQDEAPIAIFAFNDLIVTHF